MPGEGAYGFPRLHIPELDITIRRKDVGLITPTCESVSIGTERYAINRPRMPGEGAYVFPRLRVPEPDGLVLTPTCDSSAIGTERYAINTPLMSGEQGEFGAGVCIIEPNTDTTRHRKPSAIG